MNLNFLIYDAKIDDTLNTSNTNLGSFYIPHFRYIIVKNAVLIKIQQKKAQNYKSNQYCRVKFIDEVFVRDLANADFQFSLRSK